MKYCPRCGSLIEGSINCIECGYIVNKDKLDNIKDINVISNKNSYIETISLSDEEYYKIQNNCTYKISTRHNE